MAESSVRCTTCTKCVCKNEFCGRKTHQANFILAQTACNSCKDEPVEPETKCEDCGSRCAQCCKTDKKGRFKKAPCKDSETCGRREMFWYGEEARDNFGSWLINEAHKNFTVLSHNGSAYDNVLILEYCLMQGILPSIIFKGSKIMTMSIKKLGLRFLDNYCFTPLALKRLPEALGISGAKKGVCLTTIFLSLCKSSKTFFV